MDDMTMDFSVMDTVRFGFNVSGSMSPKSSSGLGMMASDFALLYDGAVKSLANSNILSGTFEILEE